MTEQQTQLAKELDQHDWSQGAGPKLRQLLLRGVGVHHAGDFAQVQADRRRAVSAEAVVIDDLHRNALRGDQPAGSQRRRARI